jgi:hypothetical protein
MPGLPGAGLGGLFYVLSALVMLPIEVVQTVRGRSSLERWRVVGLHVSLAGGVVASFAVALWVLQLVLWPAEHHGRAAAGDHAAAVPEVEPASLELLPVAPVLLTLGALTSLLAITLTVSVLARASTRARR